MNRPLFFSMGLARTFTRRAALPAGAAVARDPYASHTLLKCVLVLMILALAALGVCWQLQYGPFAPKAQKSAPAATVEAQPAVAPAAAPAEAK